jgi:hypothetical protein
MMGDRAALDAILARILANALIAELRLEGKGTPVQSEGPRVDPARAWAASAAGDESRRELPTTLQVKS